MFAENVYLFTIYGYVYDVMVKIIIQQYPVYFYINKMLEWLHWCALLI